MVETISNLNQKINALKNEAMEVKTLIAETDSIIDLLPLTQKLTQLIELINENYKKVEELERIKHHEKNIIEFWTSQWDYISLYDAIKEANQSTYKGLLTIRELKNAYRKVEQYNY